RRAMVAAGVPVAAGTTEPVTDLAAAEQAAEQLGYPLMVKAAAGGGGIGVSAVTGPDQLRAAVDPPQTRAERVFGSAGVLLERYVQPARHVEVQVLGLAGGRVVALGERDCSVQRRHQKVLEEAPAPGLDPELRDSMLAAAMRGAWAVGYENAGTMEFLVDPV